MSELTSLRVEILPCYVKLLREKWGEIEVAVDHLLSLGFALCNMKLYTLQPDRNASWERIDLHLEGNAVSDCWTFYGAVFSVHQAFVVDGGSACFYTTGVWLNQKLAPKGAS